MNHTPGPWRAVAVNGIGPAITVVSESGARMADCYSTTGANRIVQAVNAYSIHADLLAALDSAIELMPLGTAVRAKWMLTASDIVARARGQS